jgi:ribosomal protein S13|tara:strand:- start:10412 stop:11365 length:954 start_codon:yes stop_codon:yes gene_type:complete
MRKCILIAVLFFVSCNDDTKIVLASSGNLNEISIVVQDQLWEGSVGKALKSILSKPIYGLPQQEPLFKLRQIPPRVFSGFVTKSRTIIIIEKNKQKHTRLLLNKYASPQTVIVVSGMTSREIIEELKKHSKKIINKIKEAEIKEKQRRIRKSLSNSQVLDSIFKIKLDYPSIYRVAAADRNFVWLRKDTKSGSVNLSVFQTSLKTNRLNTEKIIIIRDSVSKQKIPGPTKETYMSTETQYKSVLVPTKIRKYKGLEVRGLWEVKKQFMGGPFINFSVVDSINNRILFFDGFVYSPGTEKASYIFEIEAIIKSLKILK